MFFLHRRIHDQKAQDTDWGDLIKCGRLIAGKTRDVRDGRPERHVVQLVSNLPDGRKMFAAAKNRATGAGEQ